MACEVLGGEYLRPGYEIEPEDTVIDIGGNIGAFAIYAARFAHKGRVLTYEPCRDSFALLLDNLVLNKITQVSATRAAVGASDSTLTLYIDDTHTGRASLNAAHVKEAFQREMVPVVSLQSVFDQQQIETCDLLKVDCEGAEYDILYSLPHAYYSRIRRIAMEYHGGYQTTVRQEKARRLVDFLISQRFQIDVFTDNTCSDCGWIFARR
jgi:FkbM family methyltransferase